MLTPGSKEWHRDQVKKFNDNRGNHKEVADKLEEVLREIRRQTDPTAIVQVRPKALASFSEKAIRKKNKYSDPVNQLTDVVGGRIITYTQAGADQVRGLIEQLGEKAELEIDWDNSGDTAERLKPEEFGYKAMHYIVQMKAPKVLGVSVDKRLYKYKVEIQVCTILQHVWAAIGHDRVYKTRLNIPDALRHRLAAISALIDTAQADFDNSIVALDRYIEQFLPHINPGGRDEEAMKWESVLDVEPHDHDALLSHGDNCAAVGDWPAAYKAYSQCDPNMPGVLAKWGRGAARIGKSADAEQRLRDALTKDDKDWAARCDLADLLEQQGEREKALHEYQGAFHTAPGEPRVLVSYVTAVIHDQRHLSCTVALRGALDAVIEECRRRADLKVDLPDAFFQTGRCFLFRGDLYRALDAYCKATLKCESPERIKSELLAVEAMAGALSADKESARLEHFQCAARHLDLLAVAVGRRLQPTNAAERTESAANLPVPSPLLEEETDRLEKLATKNKEQRPLFSKHPVVIVAGGCDSNVEERMRRYTKALGEAFEDFEGTIICGGTKAGISGIIGQVAQQRGAAVSAIGYLPPRERIPEGDEWDEQGYGTICDVAFGCGHYSPAGPIQTWADLLLEGVEPSRVRLLGINGGELSGFEFRLAMAMGAGVGLIEDSGRAVSGLLADSDWRELGRLAPLFNETETLIPFVTAFCPTFQAIRDQDEREKKLEEMARAQHEVFRKGKLTSQGYVHPSMLPWDDRLSERYKESNRQQVAYMDRILRTKGFAIVSVETPGPAVDFNAAEFSNDGEDHEALWHMARREHGRFNAERLANGWRYGPVRDLEARTSPYLVPWDKLPLHVQEWDREPFLALHDLLAPLGLKIVRTDL